MGTVYHARHVLLGTDIALKLLPVAQDLSPDKRRRFLNEARAAQAFSHRHAIPIRDVGEEPDGTLFLAMDYSPGETLQQRLNRMKRIPFEEAITITMHILGAIAEAHRASIIHRDLKPGNILVEMREGKPFARVVDFGLARFMENAGLGATPTMNLGPATAHGTLIGTVEYMSPEQAAGETVDSRSDIYSVGVILYQMLTGRLPTHGEGIRKMLTAIMFQEPLPISSVAPDANVPYEIEAIVMKALEKNPGDRFASAREFQETLRLASHDYLSQAILDSSSIMAMDDLQTPMMPLPVSGKFSSLTRSRPFTFDASSDSNRNVADTVNGTRKPGTAMMTGKSSNTAPWALAGILFVIVLTLLAVYYNTTIRPKRNAEQYILKAETFNRKAENSDDINAIRAFRDNELANLQSAIKLLNKHDTRYSDVKRLLQEAEPKSLLANIVFQLERFKKKQSETALDTAKAKLEQLQKSYPGYQPETVTRYSRLINGYDLCRRANDKIRMWDYEEGIALYRSGFDEFRAAGATPPKCFMDDYRHADLKLTLKRAQTSVINGEYKIAADAYRAAAEIVPESDPRHKEYVNQSQKNLDTWIAQQFKLIQDDRLNGHYDKADRRILKLWPNVGDADKDRLQTIREQIGMMRIDSLFKQAVADFESRKYSNALDGFRHLLDIAATDKLKREAARYITICTEKLNAAEALYRSATAQSESSPLAAIDLFKQYRTQFPFGSRIRSVRQKEALLRDYLNTHPGLIVISTPKGATVFLRKDAAPQEDKLGQTPFYRDLSEIPPGHYELIIRHDGYLDKTLQFNWDAGQVPLQPFDIALEPLSGNVVVHTKIPGAMLKLIRNGVGDQYAQTAKCHTDGIAMFRNVPEGDYTLTTADGAYRTEGKSVTVKQDETVQTELKLTPLSASLAIRTEPPGISIFIDGKYVGKTPIPFIELPHGKHQIDIKDADGFSLTRQVNLLPGEKLDIPMIDFQKVVSDERRAWRSLTRILNDPNADRHNMLSAMHDYLKDHPDSKNAATIANKLEGRLVTAWNRSATAAELLSAAQDYRRFSLAGTIRNEVGTRLATFVRKPRVFPPQSDADTSLVSTFSGKDRLSICRYGPGGIQMLSPFSSRPRAVRRLDTGKIVDVVPIPVDFGHYAIVTLDGPSDDIVNLDTARAIVRLPSGATPFYNAVIRVRTMIGGKNIRGFVRLRQPENRPDTIVNRSVPGPLDDLIYLPNTHRVLLLTHVKRADGRYDVTLSASPATAPKPDTGTHTPGRTNEIIIANGTHKQPFEFKSMNAAGDIVIVGGRGASSNDLLVVDTKRLKTVYMFDGPFRGLAASPSGKLIVIATPDDIRIVDPHAPLDAWSIPSRLTIVGIFGKDERLALKSPVSGKLVIFDLKTHRAMPLVTGEIRGDILASSTAAGRILISNKTSRTITLIDVMSSRAIVTLALNRIRSTISGLPRDFQPVQAVMDDRAGPVALLGGNGYVLLLDLLAPTGLSPEDANLLDQVLRNITMKE